MPTGRGRSPEVAEEVADQPRGNCYRCATGGDTVTMSIEAVGYTTLALALVEAGDLLTSA